MVTKCKICGYRFKDKNQVICPECFTSREGSDDFNRYSDNKTSNYYTENLNNMNQSTAENDTFDEFKDKDSFISEQRADERENMKTNPNLSKYTARQNKINAQKAAQSRYSNPSQANYQNSQARPRQVTENSNDLLYNQYYTKNNTSNNTAKMNSNFSNQPTNNSSTQNQYNQNNPMYSGTPPHPINPSSQHQFTQNFNNYHGTQQRPNIPNSQNHYNGGYQQFNNNFKRNGSKNQRSSFKFLVVFLLIIFIVPLISYIPAIYQAFKSNDGSYTYDYPYSNDDNYFSDDYDGTVDDKDKYYYNEELDYQLELGIFISYGTFNSINNAPFNSNIESYVEIADPTYNNIKWTQFVMDLELLNGSTDSTRVIKDIEIYTYDEYGNQIALSKQINYVEDLGYYQDINFVIPKEFYDMEIYITTVDENDVEDTGEFYLTSEDM